MTYCITKTFGHEKGLSCAFRQWRADTHCNLIHGYALSFEFVVEAATLDSRNWVYNFGGFATVKRLLEETFDHKLAVAHDDPHLREMSALHDLGVVDLVILPRVGCEAFAELVYKETAGLFYDQDRNCRLISVEVREHAGNSATYIGAK